jgi:hypothetical protein
MIQSGFGITDLRAARYEPNDQAHRTQITFATQPISLGRSGAATCYVSAFDLR